MGRLLFVLALGAALFLLVMVVLAPRKFGRWKRLAERVAFAYVAAILISAAVRVLFQD